MQVSNPPVYKETLKIRNRTIYWLMAVATVISVGLPALLSWSELSGAKGWAVVAIAAFMALVWWFLLASRIRLCLDRRGVTYQFWPLKKHVACWEQLESCYLRKVDPFGEFGGWGLRFVWSKEWGYVNTSNWGLQLIFKDGAKVTVSTQRPDELRSWLAKWSPVGQSVK